MVFKNAHNAQYGYKKDKDVTMWIVNVELIFVMYVELVLVMILVV